MSEDQKPLETNSAPSRGKGPIILALVNTLVVFAAAGVFVYTRFIFHKPKITEQGERTRLVGTTLAPQATHVAGLVAFEPMIVNIATDSEQDKEEDSLHFVKMTFSFELQDMSLEATISSLKPVILDRLLSLLGRKTPQELNTVQGRYILRTDMLDLANSLIAKETGKREAVITNVYFNDFTVQ